MTPAITEPVAPEPEFRMSDLEVSVEMWMRDNDGGLDRVHALKMKKEQLMVELLMAEREQLKGKIFSIAHELENIRGSRNGDIKELREVVEKLQKKPRIVKVTPHKIAKLEREIFDLKLTLESYELKINTLEKHVSDLLGELKGSEKKLIQAQADADDSHPDRQAKRLMNQIEEQNFVMNAMKKDNEGLRAYVKTQKKVTADQTEIIRGSEEVIDKLALEIHTLKKTEKAMIEELNGSMDTIDGAGIQSAAHVRQVNSYEETILAMKEDIAATGVIHDSQRAEMAGVIESLTKKVSEQAKANNECFSAKDALTDKLAMYEVRLESLNASIHERNKKIHSLQSAATKLHGGLDS